MYSNGSALSVLGYVKTDVTRSTSKIVRIHLVISPEFASSFSKCHAALCDKCVELSAGGLRSRRLAFANWSLHKKNQTLDCRFMQGMAQTSCMHATSVLIP